MERDCLGKPWGFISNGVTEAPECIATCRNRFLQNMEESHGALDDVCRYLELREAQGTLSSLYCCDAQVCGVDNLASPGMDPNVNLIISMCHNMGYDSVPDPGPPGVWYNCQDSPIFLGENSQCLTTLEMTPGTQTVSQPSSITSSPTHPVPTETSSSMPFIPISTSFRASGSPRYLSKKTVISVTVKVAIGLGILFGVATIGLTIACLLRHRSVKKDKKRMERRFMKEPPSPGGDIRPGSSTSLTQDPDPPVQLPPPILSSHGTSDDSTPLTPPLPLKDRQIIPSSSQFENPRFPVPTAPDQVQRLHDGNNPPTAVSKHLSPMAASVTPKAPSYDHDRGPAAPASSTSIGSSVTAMGPGEWRAVATDDIMTKSSPRTPRRCLTSSDIPSPGPPPTRALPSTPSQSSLVPPPTRPEEIGIATDKPLPNPSEGVVLGQEARDLRELTEQYGCPPRTSWGSWSGGVGGGGVTMSSPKMKTRETHSPVMEEEDLERLGGRY